MNDFSYNKKRDLLLVLGSLCTFAAEKNTNNLKRNNYEILFYGY